jgi:hypothetical protein
MKDGKKPYEKPAIERVELEVHESVLTFCKGPGSQHGPLVGACNAPGSPGPCQLKGS